MVSTEVEGLNMVHFVGSEKEPVTAEEAGCLFGVNGDGHISNVVGVSALGIGELDVLEASALSVSNFSVFGVDISNSHWEELEGFSAFLV
jgi:hypothetical protein